jgi:hypothetical protein
VSLIPATSSRPTVEDLFVGDFVGLEPFLDQKIAVEFLLQQVQDPQIRIGLIGSCRILGLQFRQNSRLVLGGDDQKSRYVVSKVPFRLIAEVIELDNLSSVLVNACGKSTGQRN